jgi:hypothetical protein
MAAIKHAAETLPFCGFKESEVAAFLVPGWNLTGLASELSRE